MGEQCLTAQVLLVDDDDDLRELLGECLAECGMTVATAGDGAEALDYLRANPAPRAIILDLKMRNMDGIEFLEKRRQLEVAPSTRVVVLTAIPIVDRQHLADLGACCVLHKPVSLLMLITALDTPGVTSR